MPTEGEGAETRMSLVGGLTGERWNVAGTLEYRERERPDARRP